MQTRDFALGDILSITHGVLVSPRLMAGVYDILNFMTGENLMTHQLPRVAEEARPELLRQHPSLAAVDPSGVNRDNWEGWLADQMTRYGATLPVKPMTEAQHERIDPVSEAAEMFPPDKIIAINVGGKPDA